MSEVVRENPCTECGIKGLYEHCEDKCVQYRKWYQYQQGRADERERIKNKMESLWGAYLNDKSNVPRPDFMSAYVLICLEENNDKGV